MNMKSVIHGLVLNDKIVGVTSPETTLPIRHSILFLPLFECVYVNFDREGWQGLIILLTKTL